MPLSRRTERTLYAVACMPWLNEALRAVSLPSLIKIPPAGLAREPKGLYLLYLSTRSPFHTGGRAMTPLRQRMIEDLQLRGLSERTQAM